MVRNDIPSTPGKEQDVYTDFVIFGNYLVLAAKKNHEKQSARRKIVKLCGPPAPIPEGKRAKNQVKIRPLG
jgi:hypothetical protein